MRHVIITLALLVGLNLSAQEKKAYHLEDGRVKVEQFYPNGQLQQVSFYWNGVGTGTWLKYDEQGTLIAQAEVKNGRPTKVIRFENGITTIIDRKKNSITQIKH